MNSIPRNKRFDKNNTIEVRFYEAGELKGSSFVKIPKIKRYLKYKKVLRNIVSYGQL